MASIPSKATCKPLFKSSKILTLPCLYIYKSILYVFENKHLFKTTKSMHSYNTRQVEDIHIVQQNFSCFKKSVYIKCSQLYNKLPNDYKITTDGKLLRSYLLQLLTDKCYYSVQEFLEDNL